MKNEKGITLIALVITIVTLIILAGVGINLSIGENGIFSKAKYAKEQYEIAKVKEELEVAMLDIRSDKITKNEECTVDTMVVELPNKISDITIGKEGNIAKGTYNGYNFTINESLKVYIEGESMSVTAKTELKEYIGKDANDKYAVKIQLTLEAEEIMDEVEIENTDGTVTKETVGNKIYTKELEVELDKEYQINIKDKSGKKTSKKISVSSTSEIENVEQFVAFRDSVNSGLTYEGATINLKTDLDLSSVCYKVDGTVENDISWKPIGNEGEGNYFKGTFNGNKHKISNLYMNVLGRSFALFGVAYNANLNEIIVEGKIILEGERASGIVSAAAYTNITNCINYINIEHSGNERANCSGIAQWAGNCYIANCENYGNIYSNDGGYIAGIISNMENTVIERCKNYGEFSTNSTWPVGGIAPNMHSGNIKECANYGNISGKLSGGITGAVWENSELTIENCYNAGQVRGTFKSGGICGCVYGKFIMNNTYNNGLVEGDGEKDAICNYTSENMNIENVYYLDTSCANGKIGESKTETELRGLANVLGEEWKANDEKDTDGKWKYNNGYPILKWE